MDEKRDPVTEDEREPWTDPRDLKIALALLGRVFPPLEESEDACTAADALTPEDRQALRSLTTSAGWAERLMASARSRCRPAGECEAHTRTADMSTTKKVDSGNRFESSILGRESELDELLRRLEAVERNDLVSWQSRYRKKGVLGRGGQGVVYLAESLDDFGGEIALKIFSPEPYGDASSYTEDMQRMARVAFKVHQIHHPHLLDVDQFASQDGIHVMGMRRVEGYDLKRLLQSDLLESVGRYVSQDRWSHLSSVVFTTAASGRLCLQPCIAVKIIEGCLRGLDALHNKSIVHGDIKPANIMLDCFGNIKLVDIGSSFELDARPRHHTWTPRYAAPEFLDTGQWTPLSDFASLGYVLIELLSGQPVVTGQHASEHSTRATYRDANRALLDEKRRLPQRLRDLLPERTQGSKHLMKLCRRLIDPDPQQRFQSATEAIESEDGSTFSFSTELARVNLVVDHVQEIMRLLADVRRASPGLLEQ